MLRAAAEAGAGGLAALLVLVTGGPAAAAGAPELPCTPPLEGAQARVRAVNPDSTLLLDDGRVLRLAGLAPGEADAAPSTSEGRARLGAWLTGAPVGVRTLAATADRWNRWPALVFAPPPGAGAGAPPLSVAFAMVDAGLARPSPEPGLHACWPALRDAEAVARAARLGLWSDSDYAVLRADEAAALAAMAGRFAIVDGRVAQVAPSRGTVFVDLGPRGRALGLRLSRRVAFSLDQGGPGQDRWVGRRIRVRGVLDDQGGPVMDVQDADQVEWGGVDGGELP